MRTSKKLEEISEALASLTEAVKQLEEDPVPCAYCEPEALEKWVEHID